MAVKDLITLGLTNTADGTSQLLLMGLEAGPEAELLGAPMFKRNTDIYISKDPNATADNTNTVALRVKDFSFNRAVNITNIGRNTLDPTQERTVDPYATVLAPVNFSFTTYIAPVVDTNVTSPEEYLWVSLMGADSLTSNSTSSIIDFADGNVGTLRNLTLWFDQPDHPEGSYRVDNATVDSATISFDINSIAEIQWQGRALAVTVDGTPPTSTDRTSAVGCLRNKLSTVTLNMNSVDYNLALTGGQITINNNNAYHGRSTLGTITAPVEHYTGNRTIQGNLNFYMKTGTNTSTDLFNDILDNIDSDTYETTHAANITVNIAGITAPYVKVNVPQTILGLGTQDFSEVLAMSVPFSAKEEAGNYSTITYYMP